MSEELKLTSHRKTQLASAGGSMRGCCSYHGGISDDGVTCNDGTEMWIYSPACIPCDVLQEKIKKDAKTKEDIVEMLQDAGRSIDENGNIYMPDGTFVLDDNGDKMTVDGLYTSTNAEVQMNLSAGEEEFFKPEGGKIDFYNPYTGEILPGILEVDNPSQAITNIVNKVLGIQTTWETIVRVSFFDESNSIDPKDLVGRFTFCGLNDVCPFDIQDLFFEECEKAIRDLRILFMRPYTPNKVFSILVFDKPTPGIPSLLSLGDFLGLFRRNGPYDYVHSYHPIFGQKSGTGSGDKIERYYYSYIFNGDLIRYDAPGNMIIGYTANHFDLDYDKIKDAAAIDNLGKDNPGDSYYLDFGYQLYDQRN